MSQTPSRCDRPRFQRRQFELTAHLRAPEAVPPPGDVEQRRIAIYRELLYNNVEGFLARAFPVVRAISPDATWNELVGGFYSDHRSTSPLFREIPEEFLHYLVAERGERPGDPPFLAELAHYEWVEMALALADEEVEAEGVDPGGDLLDGVPVLSPHAWTMGYRYPVHRIGPDYRPDAAEPTFLLVHRDRHDEVGFLEVNPVSARLIELLREAPGSTGRELLERVAAEIQHGDVDVVVASGAALLEDLRRRDVILGSGPRCDPEALKETP
jgi:hypothetical protein